MGLVAQERLYYFYLVEVSSVMWWLHQLTCDDETAKLRWDLPRQDQREQHQSIQDQEHILQSQDQDPWPWDHVTGY